MARVDAKVAAVGRAVSALAVAAVGLAGWGAGEVRAAGTQTLELNPKVFHQRIEGWGSTLGATDAATRTAYRDLGMNIVRMYMPKEVLTGKDGTGRDDYRVRVPLGTDLETNLGKFNFSIPSVSNVAATAQWMKANVADPGEFKLIGDAWTPPHWMKGPTGASAPWVGNPSYNTPSRPTPWLSNEYNNWVGGTYFAGYTGDSIGGRLRTEDATNLAEYGQYFAGYVKGFERATGLQFANISLQNESGFENPFDSMTMMVGPRKSDGTYPYDPAQYARALKSVRDAFVQQGVTTPIRGPHFANLAADTSSPWGLNAQLNMINAVRTDADPTLKNALAIYTSNYYQGVSEGAVKATAAYWKGVANVPGPWVNWAPTVPGIGADGKQNWFVETGDDPTAANGWYDAARQSGPLVVALKMHNALVHADASAYLYWSFVDGSGSPTEHGLLGSAQTGNPLASKKYAAFKQFSGVVKAGAVRIDALFGNGKTSVGGASEYDTVSALDASAYYNPRDRMLSLVLINMAATSTDVTFAVPAGMWVASFDVFRTSETENYAQLAGLVPVDGRVTVSVPGRSIVSLSGWAGVVVPEPGGAAVLGGFVAALGGRRRRRQG